MDVNLNMDENVSSQAIFISSLCSSIVLKDPQSLEKLHQNASNCQPHFAEEDTSMSLKW